MRELYSSWSHREKIQRERKWSLRFAFTMLYVCLFRKGTTMGELGWRWRKAEIGRRRSTRDWVRCRGQRLRAGRDVWDCWVGGCVNVTVSFEIEGVARIQGKRWDALGEQTQKIRADNNFFFKWKLPSVSNFVITRPTVKSGVYHPKKLHIVKPCKFDHHLTYFFSTYFHTEKNKIKLAVDYKLKAPTLVETHYRCPI